MANSQDEALSQFELLLHPIRLRVIQLLIFKKRLTAHQLAEAQPDVPLTTLYRHLTILVDGGVLVVVEEHRRRGAMERVYEIVNMAPALTLEKSKEQSKESQMEFFTFFVMSLLDTFRRYLERCDGPADFAKDGVRFRQYPLWLSDQEFLKFFTELHDLIDHWQAFEPGPERTARVLSVVTLPESL